MEQDLDLLAKITERVLAKKAKMYCATKDKCYLEMARTQELKLDRCFTQFEGIHYDAGFMWLLSAAADYDRTGLIAASKPMRWSHSVRYPTANAKSAQSRQLMVERDGYGFAISGHTGYTTLPNLVYVTRKGIHIEEHRGCGNVFVFPPHWGPCEGTGLNR